MSNKVLLSGYYGFENYGDDLILYVLVEMLKRYGLEPIVLSNHPEDTSELYQVESISRIDLHRIWSVLPECKAFISGGGGLFQDKTGPGSPLYYGGLIEMAKWRGCPVAFFGQGIGPITTGLGRFFTQRALSNSTLIMVRDPKSQAWVQRMVQKPAGLMADPVWLWQPPNALTRAHQQGLGISIRPWKTLTSDKIAHLASVMTALPNIKTMGINLIDCQAGTDIIPLSALESHLNRYGIPCQWYTGNQAATGIAQSVGLVAMRYHAVLSAALLGIPTFALSYDPKVQVLSHDLGLKDQHVDTLLDLSTTILESYFYKPNPSAIADYKDQALHGFTVLQQWVQSLT